MRGDRDRLVYDREISVESKETISTLVFLSPSPATRKSENTDSETGVTGGHIGDARELLVEDIVLVRPHFARPLRMSYSRSSWYLSIRTVFAGAQATHEMLVDAAEQLFSLFAKHDRELREAVEVVNDAWIFELIDLVEDDDGSRPVMLLEAVDGGVSTVGGCGSSRRGHRGSGRV